MVLVTEFSILVMICDNKAENRMFRHVSSAAVIIMVLDFLLYILGKRSIVFYYDLHIFLVLVAFQPF